MSSQRTSANQAKLVDLQGLEKTYVDGNVRALRGISLQIGSGEYVAVMGPSGCGKSTLLNMIGALDRPTAGKVLVDSEDLGTVANIDRLRAEKIGFVFQSFYLLPNLTARENVQLPMFGLISAADRAARAEELLKRVGLAERLDHRPEQLSIGQRQRVAIARALANRPALILADEPTGSLDSTSGKEVMDLFEDLNQTDQTTLIIVTHDEAIASRANRCIRMLDGAVLSDAPTS